jgi:hypothetical protein
LFNPKLLISEFEYSSTKEEFINLYLEVKSFRELIKFDLKKDELFLILGKALDASKLFKPKFLKEIKFKVFELSIGVSKVCAGTFTPSPILFWYNFQNVLDDWC